MSRAMASARPLSSRAPPSARSPSLRARSRRAPRTSARLYESVVDTIGDTPCVRLQRIAPEGVTMYAKLEYFNPLSSVKDRLAASIILEAEAAGLIKPGDTVVEATSGNTGIAVAMVCAARGYKCVTTSRYVTMGSV